VSVRVGEEVEALSRRLKVEMRGPWSTRRRKHRELMVRVRVQARGRWRWWCVLLQWPRDTMSKEGRVQSVTLEAKSWLTDRSMRGNLRHKAFVRLGWKAGIGGATHSARYCTVRGPKGEPCTWERGHCPMVVRFSTFRFEEQSGAGAEYEHSWAVKRLGLADRVLIEPRRPSAG